MENNRLFTFGCSFTKYKWPTWADIIGTNYKEFHNLGHAGAGNYYIGLKLYETHLEYNITSTDDVIIMLSSSNRFDIYNPTKQEFVFAGNVYNCEKEFGTKFVKDVWNDTHSIYNTWFMVKSIKTLLDSIGCRYKIVEAFDLTETDTGYYIPHIKNVKHLIEDYTNSVYVTEKLHNFARKYTPKSYNIPNIGLDGHPTIMCNHDFIKHHISEFYHPQMEIISKKWESEIGDNALITKFSSQKIKTNLF
jgi:hypothetical protein